MRRDSYIFLLSRHETGSGYKIFFSCYSTETEIRLIQLSVYAGDMQWCDTGPILSDK